MTFELETWLTRDYGGDGKALSMSKKVLGDFVYHLLRLGGEITSTHAMRPDLDRTYVQFGIRLPKGRREELEAASGITLEAPSFLVPAGSSFRS